MIHDYVVTVINPIGSSVFHTANDPGGGGGGALNDRPCDLENDCIKLYHNIYLHFIRCYVHVPI